MPGQTNIATKIATDIELNLPLLSAAMDTVTEARLAIAMAQAGGIGVIHRNLTPTEQAEQVRQVKKFESGMVVNPVTIGPDATLAEALGADEGARHFRHSGRREPRRAAAPASWSASSPTATSASPPIPSQKVYELMTRENLITVKENIDQTEAKRLLHKHRIEKLLVVDDAGHCIGLITVKDIEKSQLNPNASKDAQGRLRVAAATSRRRRRFRARRAADRCRHRPAGHRYRAWPFAARARRGDPRQEAVQLASGSWPAMSRRRTAHRR
ncbi:MAG: IMP dehydrogenase [Pirellulales bacterium]